MNAEARLRVAEAAERSGDHELAVSMYAVAAGDAAHDDAVLLRSVEGLSRGGRLEEAAALLKRRLREGGRSLEVLQTLGSILVLEGQAPQAEAMFGEVLAARPRDVRALTNKAIALDLQRRHAEAQTLYHVALGQAPGDPIISNDLALSLLLSGRVAEARQVLRPFQDSEQLPERVRINLGILEAAGGNGIEAQRLLAGSVTPTDLAMLTHAIATVGPTQPLR